MARRHNLPLDKPYLAGDRHVGQTLALNAPGWPTDKLHVSWWRGAQMLQSGTGPEHHELVLTDADAGQTIHAELTLSQAGPAKRAQTAPIYIPHIAPGLRPLVFDDVLDQHSEAQLLPVGNVFTGDDLRYRVLRGDATIDSVSGQLQIPTERMRKAGRITIAGQNSGGTALYDVQYTVEGEDKRAATRMTDQLTADGVTFVFAQQTETGNFITGAMGVGDPFVVGPVTLLGYSPGPTVQNGRTMNGAMLNPPCTRHSGFDSIAIGRTYREALNVGLQLPLTLLPGDSLIVTVSNPEAQNADQAAQHFVILSCVAEPPFEDSFRPPYSGRARPIWRASDINPGMLARLPHAGRTRLPEKDALEARFGRFALEIARNWNRGHLRGQNHAPLYGRDLCQNESTPYVWANFDVPYGDKEQIVHGLIQRGIDRYGVFRSAQEQGFHPWSADGAHNAGRKFSIMFAGHLLDDDDMRHVMRQSRGADGAAAGFFQEDGMTFHVTPQIVQISNSEAWKPPYRDNKDRPKQPYVAGMIGMPDWRGKPDDTHVNAAWTGHPYRLAGNHNTQHGQVLAALAMGLQDAWDHDAYFDYHIRYMEIMGGRRDPWQFRGGEQAVYNPVEGSRRRNGFDDWKVYWRDPWAWHMLLQYRFEFYEYPWDRQK